MTVLVAGPQVPSMKFPKSGTNGRPDAVTSNRPCNIREDGGKCAESARQIYWLLAMTDSCLVGCGQAAVGVPAPAAAAFAGLAKSALYTIRSRCVPVLGSDYRRLWLTSRTSLAELADEFPSRVAAPR